MAGQDNTNGTNGSSPHGAAMKDMTRVVLRPIAGSAPLGFIAFGVGTIIFSAQELGWLPLSQYHSVSIVLLAFVVPLEIIAGLIAYFARDGGLATTLTMFGAVWAAIAISQLSSPPGSTSLVLGIFLLLVSLMLAAMSASSIKTRPLLFALSALATARYALSGVYEITSGVGVEHASGWLGFPILAIAVYGGAALLLEDTMRRTVLPIGRRHDARDAMEGGLSDQIDRITQEAGIRRTL